MRLENSSIFGFPAVAPGGGIPYTRHQLFRVRWIGVLVSIAAAQDTPAPTFSAGTKLVQVDVVARGKNGPATGLTKDDFTVFDNGKPQKISFFSVRSRTSDPAAVPLPPGAVSNRTERAGEGTSNATVLLIDQRNTLQVNQAFAIQRIVKFVEMRRKGDRIGIYRFGRDGKLEALQELTDDGELLTRVAKSLKAQDPSYRSPDVDGMPTRMATEHIELLIRERESDTRQVLEAMARHLASVPGRKSLIWLGVGFPLTWPPQPGPLAADLDYNPEMVDTGRILNDANVALYGVDVRGLRSGAPGGNGERGFPAGLDTMARLAGLTGGLLYTNDNGIENLIQAAIDDGEVTCTLGFYPVQEEQDTSWHNLKVDVARPGVKVRYRENYLASVAAPVALQAKTTAANDHPTLEALIKDPLDATQLRLVGETMPDPAKAGYWQIHVSVDLNDVHLEKQDNIWVGGVDVSLSVEGSRTFRTVTTKFKIPDAGLAAALGKGITVNDSIAFDGHTGELRIVAQDRATGAVGSIRVPLGRN